MARLSYSPAAVPGAGGDSQNRAAVELSQLLSRLQQSVLHPTPEREHRLRTSEYERARLEANLEYARAQLFKLEQDALALKAPTRRLELQGALTAHQDTLETLVDRLEDLRQLAEDDEGDDSSDEEDLLADIVPTPSESMDSTSAEATEDRPEHEATPDPPSPTPAAVPEPPPAPTAAPAAPPIDVSPTTTIPPVSLPTQTSQTLRSRMGTQTPTSHTTARAALFANRRRGEAAATTPQTSTATAEAILDHQRVEQDVLSDSILKMAGALKASSQRFSTTLEADKEALGRAGEGMDRTERGMDATRGGMGALRRMTEGKGWWGRMILYAWVYGLMLALVLLVFVMPKLRF
ncbi:hypothetical protein JDV02_007389 [Purpureocillium takamizusanense]|uniref:Synaptobrevin n=1 Tax=Purpureocillium takamizusanense TaxID=2060973 RepID=A0A9Q8VC99_9HYPO|nr:uncharacterized protein JDV02_007389 [Purpureocillium takamizusanense]UNI21395.1 hypothetical protein JDV02_007389 [Purpureocillium takamizusanense]